MSTTLTPDDLRHRLAAYLTQVSGSSARVVGAQPLAGGASRDMWVIDVEIDGEALRLVLRRDSATVMYDQALSRASEFRLMQFAHEQGVRVARPRWCCTDPEVLGSPFFLMEYVPGVAIGRKVVGAPELAAARAVLPQQMAEQLARIHQLDPTAHGLDFLPRPPQRMSPVQEVLDQTYALLDALDITNPAFEFALRWAARHAPAANGLTLVHGDFRVGNLIVDADGLAAVADWEFAHLGDPDEELGYLCMRDWRFGVGHLRMGGLSDRETFLRAYEYHSGRAVSREAVDFWELIGNLRWGAICLAQANRHLSGQDQSVEYASLGRRSAEMQYEMLRLIEQMGR